MDIDRVFIEQQIAHVDAQMAQLQTQANQLVGAKTALRVVLDRLGAKEEFDGKDSSQERKP